MNCQVCGKPCIGVEYAYNDPNHYDGVSEWWCKACGIRIGRWSGKHLGDGDYEKPYGGRS